MGGEISSSLWAPSPCTRFPEQCVEPGDNPLYYPGDVGAGALRSGPCRVTGRLLARISAAALGAEPEEAVAGEWLGRVQEER